MACALNASGNMSMFLGSYGDAWRRLDEALAIYRALGYLPGVADSVSRMACIASMQGQLDEAEGLAREGVAASLEAGSRTQWALALLDLGEVLEKVAKLTEAHAALLQSLALLTDLGHRGYITQAHTDLGIVDLHMGHYEEARDHVQTGLALAREHGPRFCVATNLLLLGCLELAQRAPAMAHQLLEQSAAVYREVGHKGDLGLALACLAVAARGLGDMDGARKHLSHALEIAQESGGVPPLMWALPAMSLLLAAEGENERAVELYALASRYPLVPKSRWFSDVAGNEIAAAAATLPAERIALLEERGQVRNLQATAVEFLSELRT